MTQDKVSALLGRPLSSVEISRFSTYIALAQERVSDILCVDICPRGDTKRFEPRRGYKTLSVPIFTEIDSVKVDGVIVTSYTTRQGSKLDGDWYNSLVFDAPLYGKVVEITADWGFSPTPVDVQLLIAEQFGMLGDSLDDDLVQSKQVEDFRVTLKDKTKEEAFASKYAATIAKYSCCVNGNIQSGNVHARHLLYI